LGAEEARELDWMPLQAVLRIFQAPTTRLVPIAAQETCRHLADAAFEIRWQNRRTEVVGQAFSAVAHVARHYPGWELYFHLQPEMGRIMEKVFG